MLRRLLGIAAVVAALGAAAWRIHNRVLPQLEPAATSRLVGTFHVHSRSSHDCDLSLEAIAAAASALAYDFVILTDHNNQLAAPVVIDGVTLLSFAELSTPYGHVVQFGATALVGAAERQRLGVLSTIRNGGGLPVVTHPADAKRPWTGYVDGVAGIEIANLASAARRRGGPIFAGLVPTALAFHLNRPLALVQLLDRDAVALRRWDAESDPRVFGICGNDAHGRFFDLTEEASAWQLVLDLAEDDETPDLPGVIVRAIAAGRFHCNTGWLGRDPTFDFYAAQDGERIAEPGDTAPAAAVDELVAVAPRASIETPTLVLLRHGLEMARTQSGILRYEVFLPGTYRVEVRLPVPGVLFGTRFVPAIYSNRIRISEEIAPTDAPPPATRVPPP